MLPADEVVDIDFDVASLVDACVVCLKKATGRCSVEGCTMLYCSKQCIAADWARHKPLCPALSEEDIIGNQFQELRTICSVCEKNERIGKCAKCFEVRYCREGNCQEKDWPVHRTMCRAMKLANRGDAQAQEKVANAMVAYGRGDDSPAMDKTKYFMYYIRKAAVAGSPTAQCALSAAYFSPNLAGVDVAKEYYWAVRVALQRKTAGYLRLAWVLHNMGKYKECATLFHKLARAGVSEAEEELPAVLTWLRELKK